MKKILFLFAAAFAMLLTACNGCKPEPVEPTEDAVVIKTDNPEKMIQIVNPIIAKKYPTYVFYEMSGTVKKDSTVYGLNHNTVKFAYGCTVKPTTVIATIINDTLRIVEFDEPWLEDVYMTPFVPLSLDLACKTIGEKLDFIPDGQPAVLRHQLYLISEATIEPQWIVGNFSSCHTCGIYSLRVDASMEPIKESGLKSELEAKKAK